MKTVIVFESMFGNTERFAREMVRGFAGVGHQVALVDVRHVRPEDVQECDLLVVGAPTHAFSLSRPGTRQDAVAKGADPAHAAPGVREWLTTLDAGAPSGQARPVVAVFDSRVTKVRHLPGSAARRAVRILRARGFEVLDDTRSFYVVDTTGPPAPGECTRARAWAAGLAPQVVARPSPVA
jgi:hypothetical protein